MFAVWASERALRQETEKRNKQAGRADVVFLKNMTDEPSHQSRQLRKFFSHDRFFSRVKLPLVNKWTQATIFQVDTGDDLQRVHMVLRFVGLDELGHVPFFRQVAAMARLVHGALRSLAFERHPKGDFLGAHIQPSQQWNSSHVVSFRWTRDGLAWTACKCLSG